MLAIEAHVTASTSTGKVGRPRKRHVSRRERRRWPASTLLVVAAMHHPAPEDRTAAPFPRDYSWRTPFHPKRPQARHSRSSVRANVPASSGRVRDRFSSWTMRTYRSHRPGGCGPESTSRCNSVSTRRPHQPSSGSCRSESPRARRIRCARQVCRPCTHWPYTP